MSAVDRLNETLDRWLTGPEANAAGRIGLFRIVYGLFYLWLFSRFDYTVLGRTAQVVWRPIQVDRLLPSVPPVAVLQALECLLVFALVLLIVGYRVRLVTAVVLLVGVALEVFRYSFGKVDHDTLFMVFYLPLFMLMGRWGATYSLDTVLKAHRTGTTIAASDSSWRYIWPMRAILLLLGILFLSAAYWKSTHGTWESNPATLSNFLLSTGLGQVADGGTLSPVIGLLVRLPLVTALMQAGMMAFEALFFLSLFNRKLRNWFLALAVIFHAANFFLLQVNFITQVSAYLLFVDWQRLYARWLAPSIARVRFPRLPLHLWVGAVLIVALVTAVLWGEVPSVRLVLTFGGLVTADTIWLVLLPVAVVVWLRSSLTLLRSLWKRARTGNLPAVNAPN